jgi:hypothetical protein
MDDRRTEMRKKLMAFTPVRDKARGVLLGYLGNLTFQGALVVGERPLEIKSQVTLDIEIPDELPGLPASHMTINARVARCVKDEESVRDFNIGFEFIGITPEHTLIIQSLLDRYHFRHRDWMDIE